jgi:hypothetical protein
MKTNMISYAANFHAVPITYQNARKSYFLYFYQCAGDFFHTLHSALCAPAQFSLMDLCQCSWQRMFKYDDIFLNPWSFSLLK